MAKKAGKLDDVKMRPAIFWNAHYTTPRPEKKPAPVAPKSENSKPQAKPEKKTDAPPAKPKQKAAPAASKVETRKVEAKDDLLTLMSGVNQAGTTEDDVLDLDIPDVIVALPAPAPVVTPKPAAPPAPKPQVKPAPKLRLLLKKPLTPGYVAEMMEYFEEGERLKGTPENRRRINACSYTLSRIEKDESSSAAVRAEFIKRVLALRPKQEPVQKPSLLDEGRIETLMQQAIDAELAKGLKRAEAAGEATELVFAIVHREVTDCDLGRAFDRVKNWLQTFFLAPLREQGGVLSMEEINETNELTKACFDNAHDIYFEPESKQPHQSQGRQPARGFATFGDVVNSAATRMPTTKTVEGKQLSPEEQAARAAEKKAERVKRQEEQALARDDGSYGAKKKALTPKKAEGKAKGKQGGKGQRRQEARA